jgi:hypothetical protein
MQADTNDLQCKEHFTQSRKVESSAWHLAAYGTDKETHTFCHTKLKDKEHSCAWLLAANGTDKETHTFATPNSKTKNTHVRGTLRRVLQMRCHALFTTPIVLSALSGFKKQSPAQGKAGLSARCSGGEAI